MGSVEVRVEPPIGWIVFNRPERLNAMDKSLLSETIRALEDLGSRGDVAFIAVTGKGKAFSAGMDLKALSMAGSLDEVGEAFELLARMFRALLAVEKVTIAAVNGVAAGGGAELLWAVDLSVAVRGVRIMWPEALWGLIPPALSTIGPQILGPARAAYLAMASGEVTAEEAYRLGLVSKLVERPEDLEEAVREMAREVMRSSPAAVNTIRRILRSYKASLALELGVSELIRLSRRGEVLEASRSFAGRKRPPEYKWL